MLRSVIYIHSWDSVVGVNLIITQDSSSTMSIHSSAIRLNGLFKWLLLREEASYPLPWYNVWNRTIERQGAIISTGCVSFTYRSEWSWRLAIWWTICLRISRLFPHLTRKQEIEEAGIRAKMEQISIVYPRELVVTRGRWEGVGGLNLHQSVSM